MLRGGGLQVVRVLPELRATMHFLWENRRAWHERYMVELANDRNKSAAEKEAERVRSAMLRLQAHTVTAEMPPLAAAQALHGSACCDMQVFTAAGARLHRHHQCRV